MDELTDVLPVTAAASVDLEMIHSDCCLILVGFLSCGKEDLMLFFNRITPKKQMWKYPQNTVQRPQINPNIAIALVKDNYVT